MTAHASLPVGELCFPQALPSMSASPPPSMPPNPRKRPSPISDTAQSTNVVDVESWQSPRSSMTPSLPTTPLPSHLLKSVPTNARAEAAPSSAAQSESDDVSASIPAGLSTAGAPAAKRQKLTLAEKEERRKEKEEADRRKTEQVGTRHSNDMICPLLTESLCRKLRGTRRSD